MTVLLQGAELGTFRVPLHKVHLKCGLVTGAVVVGVRPSLPVQGVSLILGNDLAGLRTSGMYFQCATKLSVANCCSRASPNEGV